MVVKHWIAEALRDLTESLAPVPHEINEIDWKIRLSDNSARLVEHLMAFANHPGGSTLVFGVDDDGAEQRIAVEEVANVVGTLTKSAALFKIYEINEINELN
jgi:ATP-dependent DNA helicase RecG